MKRSCDCCLGTGQQLLLRSMFLGDGFRRERCGICAGSGKSSYHDGKFANWQRKVRIMEAAMKAAPKGLDYIALGRIANEAVQS